MNCRQTRHEAGPHDPARQEEDDPHRRRPALPVRGGVGVRADPSSPRMGAATVAQAVNPGTAATEGIENGRQCRVARPASAGGSQFRDRLGLASRERPACRRKRANSAPVRRVAVSRPPSQIHLSFPCLSIGMRMVHMASARQMAAQRPMNRTFQAGMVAPRREVERGRRQYAVSPGILTVAKI
jgi:hypothetical protein